VVTLKKYRSIGIKWDKPLSPNGIISHYIVYYGSTISARVLPGSVTERTVRGDTEVLLALVDLVPSSMYSVWVRAVNVEKTQSLLGSASLKTTFLTPPSQPRNVSVFDVQTTSAHITWDYSNKKTQNLTYEIRVANRSLLYLNKIVNTTDIKVMGLKQLTRYNVSIVVVHNMKRRKSRSRPSQNVTFSTLGEQNTAPKSIRSSVSGVSAIITWQPPAEMPRSIIFYWVVCRNVSANEDKPFYNEYVRSQETSTTISALVPHTQYEVEIVGLLVRKQSGEPDTSLTTAMASHNFTTNQIGEETSAATFTTITKKDSSVPSEREADSAHSDGGGNIGVIVGVVIATIAVMTIPAIVFIVWMRMKRRVLQSTASDKSSYDPNLTSDLPLKTLSTEQAHDATDGLSAYGSSVMEQTEDGRGQKMLHMLPAEDFLECKIGGKFRKNFTGGVEISLGFPNNSDGDLNARGWF
jgi:hypothetical protein